MNIIIIQVLSPSAAWLSSAVIGSVFVITLTYWDLSKPRYLIWTWNGKVWNLSTVFMASLFTASIHIMWVKFYNNIIMDFKYHRLWHNMTATVFPTSPWWLLESTLHLLIIHERRPPPPQCHNCTLCTSSCTRPARFATCRQRHVVVQAVAIVMHQLLH